MPISVIDNGTNAVLAGEQVVAISVQSVGAPAHLELVVTAPNGSPVKARKHPGQPAYIVSLRDLTPEAELSVRVVPADGQAFPEGCAIRATVTEPNLSQHDAVVRNPVNASGYYEVHLLGLASHADGVHVFDRWTSAEPTPQWAWLEPGRLSARTCRGERLPHRGKWSLVVDGSASMLDMRRRTFVGDLLSTTLSALVELTGRGPNDAMLCLRHTRSFSAQLTHDTVDWTETLGDQPGPWARVGHGVSATINDLNAEGHVVVVIDSIPVDCLELTQLVQDHPRTFFTIVAIGQSPLCVDGYQPAGPWDDELAPLRTLAAASNSRVLAVAPPPLHHASTTEIGLSDTASTHLAHALVLAHQESR